MLRIVRLAMYLDSYVITFQMYLPQRHNCI